MKEQPRRFTLSKSCMSYGPCIQIQRDDGICAIQMIVIPSHLKERHFDKPTRQKGKKSKGSSKEKNLERPSGKTIFWRGYSEENGIVSSSPQIING